jgi:hypothetical protein
MEKGDALPFFDVTTVGGEQLRYSDLWQRKNVLLVCLPAAPGREDDAYVGALTSRAEEIDACGAVLVVTRDRVTGMPAPGLAIADRWGEVQYLAASASTRDLPDVQDILDTLDFVQRRCPECEGEWR